MNKKTVKLKLAIDNTVTDNAPSDFALESLENVRNKLIDLTARNPLLNFKHTAARCIRIIDELPDQIYDTLQSGNSFKIIPVPNPTKKELIEAKYIKINKAPGGEIKNIDPTSEQWAKHIKIDINHDVPDAVTSKQKHQKHNDENLQTLMFPKQLESRLRNLRNKSEVAMEESGINILYLTLGFLEWYESSNSKVTRLAPLFTLPIVLTKSKLNKTTIPHYTLSLKDDGLMTNITLSKKLESEFGITLPEIDDDITPEKYFDIIEKSIIKLNPTWSIRRQVSLVLLNYSKQTMYMDLDPERWPDNKRIEQHPLIKRFFCSGGNEENNNVLSPSESEYDIDEIENIDDKFPLIYDADSSQHSALIDAVEGKSIVIEGPPGSGKSQTITNLIAAAINNGKNVLFVSEKMAALSVVKTKLDKANLGDFCLELHSHKANKLEILTDLMNRICSQDEYTHPSELLSDIDYRNKLKDKLNSYVDKINAKVGNTELSTHYILNKVSRYRAEIDIDPNQLKIENINSDTFTPKKRKELSNNSIMLYNANKSISEQAEDNNIQNHFWYGIENHELNRNQVKDLYKNLENWLSDLQKLKEYWAKTCIEFNMEINGNNSIKEIKSFNNTMAKLPVLSENELSNIEFIQKNTKVINELVELYKLIHDEEEMKKDYILDNLPKIDILTKWRTVIENAGFFKIFSSEYNNTKKSILLLSRALKLNKEQTLKLISDFIVYIEKIENVNKLDAKNLAFKGTYATVDKMIKLCGYHKTTGSDNIHLTSKIFNLSFKPNEYSEKLYLNIKAILVFLEHATGNETLKKLLFNINIDQYNELPNVFNTTNELISNNDRSFHSFLNLGNVNLRKWTNGSNDIDSIIEKNTQAVSNKNWLSTWIDYIRLNNKLNSNGLDHIIQYLNENNIDLKQLDKIVEFISLYQIVEEILQDDTLAEFNGMEHSGICEKFCEYDRKIMNNTHKMIAHNAAKCEWIIGNSSGNVSTYSGISLISHEGSKKKRHIPIRSLIRRAGSAIQEVKPCFMMSPMSVAQYLPPGEFEFDMLIMDEASQIKPEDALGVIARCKQVVVVGDPKQMPPSNFFNKLSDEDSDEVIALEESESILDTMIPMFPTRRLRWHYRSRHESLIAFSNKYFYNSDLILFPSPFQENDEFGVKYNRVKNGRFQSGKSVNTEEAAEIVDFIVDHLKENNDESIGVVAMNIKQQEEIDRQLEHLAANDYVFAIQLEKSRASKDPLFIKNLENVQGDERDVVVISMTYGPREVGERVAQRFGPINRDDGWRRLNVLFTRSKKRMVVFSSMDSGDIMPTADSKRGVVALKNFLAYCETGHLYNTAITGKEPDSDFEISVIEMLASYGYECEPQVGVSGYSLDISVRDPGQPGNFLMCIECDGATYHSAKSARDRDRLRQEILEGLGWIIMRIWSTDWFKNPEAVIQPIIKELDKLKTVTFNKD